MRTSPAKRAAQVGFTLLEVFIATAILGVAILYMFDALSHSPDRANRAKLVTVATNLARTKMIDVEADLLKDGWEEFDDEECGDFNEDEYGNLARFQWCVRIDKIELPETVDVGSAVGKMLGGPDPDDPVDPDNPVGQSGGQSSIVGMWMGGAGGLPGAGGAGGSSTQAGGEQSGLASMLTAFLAPFRNVVEQAIRRITLRVFWKYRGKEQEVTLIYYVTRPELVDQALIGGLLGGMGGQTGSTSGSSKSSSSSKSTSKK